eukprot:4018514-Pleurochrysis_carterae.AAC.1
MRHAEPLALLFLRRAEAAEVQGQGHAGLDKPDAVGGGKGKPGTSPRLRLRKASMTAGAWTHAVATAARTVASIGSACCRRAPPRHNHRARRPRSLSHSQTRPRTCSPALAGPGVYRRHHAR